MIEPSELADPIPTESTDPPESPAEAPETPPEPPAAELEPSTDPAEPGLEPSTDPAAPEPETSNDPEVVLQTSEGSEESPSASEDPSPPSATPLTASEDPSDPSDTSLTPEDPSDPSDTSLTPEDPSELSDASLTASEDPSEPSATPLDIPEDRSQPSAESLKTSEEPNEPSVANLTASEDPSEPSAALPLKDSEDPSDPSAVLVDGVESETRYRLPYVGDKGSARTFFINYSPLETTIQQRISDLSVSGPLVYQGIWGYFDPNDPLPTVQISLTWQIKSSVRLVFASNPTGDLLHLHVIDTWVGPRYLYLRRNEGSNPTQLIWQFQPETLPDSLQQAGQLLQDLGHQFGDLEVIPVAVR